MVEEVFFHDPQLSAMLRDGFVEARLHTDRPSPHLERILELQERLAETLALPTYVLVDPDTEKRIGRTSFRGSAAGFREFLHSAN